MARYLYNARDQKGELARGITVASSLEEASRQLRADGKFVVKLHLMADEDGQPASLTLKQHARRVRREDVIFFAHQLAVMIETGVPISDALDCIVEQSHNTHFKEVVRDVAQHVQAGGELSNALRKYPNVFPTIMVSLVRASEVSGTMGQMLERISRYLAKEHATYRQVRGALMYPMFMICMAVVVTIALMTFVLPRFAAIYKAKQANLPGPTQLLLTLSNSMVNYWQFWLIGALALAAGIYLWATSSFGRRGMDYVRLHAPILRNLYVNLYVTRACRTMGTMLSAGVSMLDTITIVRQVTNNCHYDALWDSVDESLRQGMQLSDPLFKSKLMPRSVVQMIRSGEKSGRLGQVMLRLAEHTEAEFDDAVKNTAKFIEPAMVIVMGGIVGFIAISLLLPIFNASQVMAGR